MTARTHDLAAITAYGIVVISQPVRTVSVATALFAVLANQLGGVAPDIDQPTAPLWRNLPITKYLGKGVGRLLGGHRFLTHSLLGLFLFGVGFMWLLDLFQPIMPRVEINIVWWAFMIGMVSHLVMDTFTKEGVPWLLPIPVKFGVPPLKRLRITTGKIAEKAIFTVLFIAIIWLFSANYSHLVQVFHHIS